MAGLVYDFKAVGVAEVTRAIDNIQKRYQKSAKELEKATSNIGKTSSKQDTTAIKGLASFGKAARQIDYKLHMDRLREIKQEESARIRSAEKANKEAIRFIKREASERQRFARATASRVVGATGRGISQAGRLVGLGAGLAGAVSVGGAVSEAMQNSTAATAIANQAKIAGDPRSRQAIKDDILSTAGENANKFGTTKSQQIEQLQAFMDKAGDFKAGTKLLTFMNELGNATGATADTLKDMATATGNLYASLVKQGRTPEEAQADTKAVMKNAAVQGITGAIGPEDLPGLISELSASAITMQGDFKANFASLMELANTAMQGGGAKDAAEAGTAGMRVSSELYAHKKQITSAGLGDIFDKQGLLKPISEVMPKVIEKTGGDPGKIGKLLGERASKMFMGDAVMYARASDKKGALGSIKGRLEKVTGATVTDEQIQAGSKFAMEDPAKKFQVVMNEFNDAIAGQLLPVITSQLIPALTKLAPYVADAAKQVATFAGFLATDPFTGIGLIMAAFITKELAAAAISQVVSSGMATLLAALAAQGGVSGLAAKGLTAGGTALAGAAGLEGGAAAAAGAGIATAAAGVAMAASVGAAVYNGFKLYKETAGVETTGDTKHGPYTKADQEKAWADAAAKQRLAAEAIIKAADKLGNKSPSDKPIGAK